MSIFMLQRSERRSLFFTRVLVVRIEPEVVVDRRGSACGHVIGTGVRAADPEPLPGGY